MEAVGQLEQIIRQNVRAKIVQHLRDHFRKLAETFREIDLRFFGKNQLVDLCSHGPVARLRNAPQGRGYIRFAEDRLDPDIRIL